MSTARQCLRWVLLSVVAGASGCILQMPGTAPGGAASAGSGGEAGGQVSGNGPLSGVYVAEGSTLTLSQDGDRVWGDGTVNGVEGSFEGTLEDGRIVGTYTAEGGLAGGQFTAVPTQDGGLEVTAEGGNGEPVLFQRQGGPAPGDVPEQAAPSDQGAPPDEGAPPEPDAPPDQAADSPSP